MPIELSQLKANTRAIIVPYYDDTVRVGYRPSEMTPLKENEIRAAANDGDNLPMLETLSAMIIEWDVLGGDGKPIARTVEVLETLPSAFLTAIFNAIREDMTPKAKGARGSFAR